MYKKRRIAGMVLSLLLVILLTGCTKKSESDEKVKILLGKESLCLAPVHIAVINGYFDEEFESIGQEYELVAAEVNQAAELITSKKINAAYGLTGSLIQPISNGLAITFTSGLHTGCTKYYVKADAGITRLEELKGKTIGVPALSDSSVINLKRKLQDLGLNMKSQNIEAKFVVYSMTDLPVALDNGAVDAIGIHDPVATTAEKEFGFTKILDTGVDEKFKDEYCCQAYVSNALINSNPEGAAGYTRAMQRAAAFIEENPEEAAQLQIDNGYMSGDAAKNAEILRSLDYTPSVSLGKKTFEKSFVELQKMGEIDDSLSIDAFLKKSYTKLANVPDTYVNK